VEWEWLGEGTFGRVIGATVPVLDGRRRVCVALKLVPLEVPVAMAVSSDNSDSDGMDLDLEDDAAKYREATTAALLSLADAPSFVRQYGALELADHEQCAVVARLVAALGPDGTPEAPPGGYLVMAQERLAGKALGITHYLTGIAGAAGALALLFQFMWSLGVAEAKLGFEHRDMAMHNIMLAATSAPLHERYTLTLPYGEEHVFTLRHLPGRLVLLDYGASTTWNVARNDTAVPDPDHEHTGSLLAPESYFVTRRYPHNVASERYVAGLIAFSILGAPHLEAVLTPAEFERVRTYASSHGHRDLAELLTHITEPEYHTEQIFKDRLLDALALLRVDPPASDLKWRRMIADADYGYGNVYGKYLGQALLMRALGLGDLPPAHNAMVTAPRWKMTHVWYRLLSHAKVRAFFTTELPARRLQQRCFDAMVARMPPDQVQLLRALLAWDPDARPSAATVLMHPAFARLRSVDAAAPAPARMRFYSWHAQPALTATAPQRHDAAHMDTLRVATDRAIHVPELAAGKSLQDAVITLARDVARHETGL
jgi:hypothetical protein